jgi:hypothetical protein
MARQGPASFHHDRHPPPVSTSAAGRAAESLGPTAHMRHAAGPVPYLRSETVNAYASQRIRLRAGQAATTSAPTPTRGWLGRTTPAPGGGRVEGQPSRPYKRERASTLKRLPASGDPADSSNGSIKRDWVNLDRLLTSWMLHSTARTFPSGDGDRDKLFGTLHVFSSDGTNPLYAPLVPQSVVLGGRRKDSAATGGELPPHTQFDLEALFDQVVGYVVRHEVVVARCEPRHQRRPMVALDSHPVPAVFDLRE